MSLSAAAALLVVAIALSPARAQRSDAFPASRDHAAIAYSSASTSTAVDALNRRLASGEASLAFEPVSGYLRSLLAALQIPAASQVLIFSQTSLQAPKINEGNPRAVFFNDTVAVGWVRGGDVLEVSAHDATQGAIFYFLTQAGDRKPVLERRDTCLTCHLSWDTRAVPGPVLLTTYPRRSEAEYANGGFIDHREPLRNRWGGWYVTGKQVPTRHMGNRPLIRKDAAEPEDTPPPPAYQSMQGKIDLHGYLSPYSDIVALMVLDHQMHAANLITRLGWEARLEAHSAPRGGTAGAISPRLQDAVTELIDYLLFVDEVPLPAPIAGASGFAEQFAQAGPRDAQGRSLRDLDLRERIMRYPLSYMIYTPAFAALPAQVQNAAFARLGRVLSGAVAGPKYAHLTAVKRTAIVEILRATLPGAAKHLS